MEMAGCCCNFPPDNRADQQGTDECLPSFERPEISAPFEQLALVEKGRLLSF